jgi:hypothetical protein
MVDRDPVRISPPISPRDESAEVSARSADLNPSRIGGTGVDDA